ncbi:MAG: adenylyltransferase/cytidyltransferase family protein [Candidatus Pacearchaeota archaeon]
MQNKVKTIEELEIICKELHSNGKKIVTTNGCFDIIHTGHISLLEYSKSLGDILIVFVNSDNSVKRLKGDKRPILNEKDRVKLLAALESVDYICIFDEDKPLHFLEKIKTDFHVKGKEVKGETRAFISKWGGKYVQFGIEEGKSTTEIIERILSLYSNKDEAEKEEENLTLLVDIDGTICPQVKKGQGYNNLEPFKDAIETINKLYDEGFRIILYTSRFMGYNKGDILKIYREKGNVYIEDQLKKWGLKYHELYLGKPQSDIIIDDRALFFERDWKKIYKECIKLKQTI